MATTIEQQVALDESLVPSTQRLRIGRSNFRLPSGIQSKESTLQVVYDEFWATAKLHHNSIHFKIDTKKSVLDLEAFREMLHISPRIPSQSFAELPSKEEILDFLSLPSQDETKLIGIMLEMMFYSLQSRWYRDTRNSKAYKEYYACATGEASPKLKASARKKKGDSASSTTPPTPIPTTTVGSAPRLSATAKGKDEGTGSRLGVPDVPSDDSEEELSWNSSDDKEGDEQTKGRDKSEGESDDGSDDDNDDDNDETVKASSKSDKDDDDNDDEEEPVKNDDEDTVSGKGGDEFSESKGEGDDEETRQEEKESFDLIPRTPEGNEDESNDKEDQELRLSEEARIQEEEEADELYCDVNINQGKGLQVTQYVEDSHVTLTPFQPDGPQESSSMSSFVTSMLNPTSDVGVESIFTTASSSIVSLQTPRPIMTPSTIATITTSSEAPIPPTTILSIILENLPTFNSAFRFDERL
nr:hypothetical protein [Tanacetum cinerariifolium]